MSLIFSPAGPSGFMPSDYQRLLGSVVDVAAAIFGAAASSILILDQSTDELVFEAVSGEGAGMLPGTRFPRTRGIAGWVLETGQCMTVDDVTMNSSFARDIAEGSAYVPTSIMAAPVIHEDVPIGVLEVLDPQEQSRSSLGDLDLLALFAAQAGVAVACVRKAMERSPALPDRRRHAQAIETVSGLWELGPDYRNALVQILTALGPLAVGPTTV